MLHHHHDPGHDHGSGHRPGGRDGKSQLLRVLVLTLGFAAVEVLGGLWTHSLTLLGDAGHMFSDSVALGMAATAAWFGKRPPSARHSYGLARAEVVTALLNGLVMVAVVVAIVAEAIQRFREPQQVAGAPVMVIAGAGLLVNVVAAIILSRGERTINVRGALVHVMGDMLGSVGALLSGAVIYFTGWMPIDPLLSVLICALILYSTTRLLREALHVLMEGVPPELDLNVVGRELAGVPEVVSVHDLHIWMLSPGIPALSAHVVMRDLKAWPRVLAGMRQLLDKHYGIGHVTLQPELVTDLGEIPLPRGAKVYSLKPENSGR
ncbi:MAG: cation diffusion facilitator family transporter [Acidiferrobacterales bacterium]